MLSNAIRAARLKSGLTQAELAEKIDVSRAAISHWEKGLYYPSPDRLVRLKQTLNCDLTDASAGATDDQGTTPRTPAFRGRRRAAAPNGLRDVSLVEIMSPHWRRDEVAVFYATDANGAEFDLLIGDPALYLKDATMISGLLFRGARLEPHVLDGTLIKLGPGRQARFEDYVVIVDAAKTGARTARFGRLLEKSANRVLLRRDNPERDEEVFFHDIATMFCVLD